MKVLVCGSRHFYDWRLFEDFMEYLVKDILYPNKISCIISGCAKGADTLAIQWAKYESLEILEYPADWKTHGKAAGHIRNQQMLDEGKPDLVIAFLAQDSRGTKDMISRAEKAGVETRIINI